MSKTTLSLVKSAATGLMYFALTSIAFASNPECPQQMAINADDAADQINSWTTAYQAFIKYSHCDDGGIAEGFDERILQLLSVDAPKYDELSGFVKKNSKFEAFVLQHVAGTGEGKLQIDATKKAANCFEQSKLPFCRKIALALADGFDDAIVEITQDEAAGKASKDQLSWRTYLQGFVKDIRQRVSTSADATQVDKWLRALDNPKHKTLMLKPENLRQKYISYDLSRLLIPKTEFLGYIGDNYQRLYIHLKSISRDLNRQDRYLVVGESVVGKNVNTFSGDITVSSIREYQKMHFGLDNKLEKAGIQSEGLLIGEYRFQEQESQPHSGTFEGVVTAYWYLDKAGEMQYDDIKADYSDSYTNNQYVGTWTPYRSQKQKIANWGERRIPFSEDLDIGAAEFSPTPKYKERGWE